MSRSTTFAVFLPSLLIAGLAGGTAIAAPAVPVPGTADQAAIQEAATWIGHNPKIDAEYHYIMSCKVHLLLFWAGKDDVGGGYVRVGESSGEEREKQEMIQILFGSDPAKAPLSINRWGAGTEVLRMADSGQPESSAFFGFMKSSKGQSVMAMERELSHEKSNGDHRFEAIINRVDDGRALSSTVPYISNQDYNLHQYDAASKLTLEQLETNPAHRIQRLDGAARQACPRVGEFLSTTLELIDHAVNGGSTPVSYCYLYNARHYTVTLLNVHPLAEKTVHVTMRGNAVAMDRTYHHLQEAQFSVESTDTGGKSMFDILIGTEGSLRGAPIQITYQPNWWFQVILNLRPDFPQLNSPGTASR